MNMRTALLAGLISAACITPVAAEEKITVTSTEGMEDAVTVRGIHFSGECGDECLLASLNCGGPLEAELMDIPSDQVAKSVAAERSVMILEAGGKTYEMPVNSFSFTEMNGTWDASAQGMDSDAIYKSLGAARSFSLSVAGRSEKLPVTKEVQAWAKACLK